MATIYRSQVSIGACATLFDASLSLGGSKNLLQHHKERKTTGFPSPVAKFGPITIYVFTELEAFYNSVLWRQSDARINDLMEGGDAA